MPKNIIKLGLPRGLLKDQTEKLFTAAGYDFKLNEKNYTAHIDDDEIEIFLARDQELALYTERGAVDAAIAQGVYLIEQKAKVKQVVSLDYGVSHWINARICLVAPEKSRIKTARDLAGKKIIARLPNITKEYLKKHKVKAEVEWTDRPSEPKVPLLGDAAVEFVNSGGTLKRFNLKIIDVLLETSPTLFMNEAAFKNKWKREKVESLGILLKGARLAKEMTGLMLHASNKMMGQVFAVLPALKKPTVTQLRGENWFDVLTVVNKRQLRVLIPQLKKVGCTDIVEFPLNKVIL